VLFPDVGVGAMIYFITAPSRTADIELNLTGGVRGRKSTDAAFAEAGTGLGGRPPGGRP
jgi:hypothetical protein